MRLGSGSYRILLATIAALAMLSWLKLNKVGFYDHYFKVIEEVEVRNSTALYQGYQLFELFESKLNPKSLVNVLIGLLVAFLFGQKLLSKFATFQWVYPSFAHTSERLRIHPPRAP